MRVMAAIFVSKLAFGLAGGCAAGTPARVPDPERAADRFVRALREDHPTAAYRLLAPELRASLPRAKFEQQWRDNREEMVELARDFARTDATLDAYARATLEDGERVVLVLEDGRWRLQGGVLDAQALGTPLDAVAALRRALKRQSLPGLLRLLARERRAAWVAAFERSIEQTSDALDLRVERQGDEAIVHLSGGGEVHLRREAGKWRIWDVR